MFLLCYIILPYRLGFTVYDLSIGTLHTFSVSYMVIYFIALTYKEWKTYPNEKIKYYIYLFIIVLIIILSIIFLILFFHSGFIRYMNIILLIILCLKLPILYLCYLIVSELPFIVHYLNISGIFYQKVDYFKLFINIIKYLAICITSIICNNVWPISFFIFIPFVRCIFEYIINRLYKVNKDFFFYISLYLNFFIILIFFSFIIRCISFPLLLYLIELNNINLPCEIAKLLMYKEYTSKYKNVDISSLFPAHSVMERYWTQDKIVAFNNQAIRFAHFNLYEKLTYLSLMETDFFNLERLSPEQWAGIRYILNSAPIRLDVYISQHEIVKNHYPILSKMEPLTIHTELFVNINNHYNNVISHAIKSTYAKYIIMYVDIKLGTTMPLIKVGPPTEPESDFFLNKLSKSQIIKAIQTSPFGTHGHEFGIHNKTKSQIISEISRQRWNRHARG